MSDSKPPFDSSGELHDLLGDWLRTRHLAQPLFAIEFHAATPISAVELRRRGFSVVGVRDQGSVIGSVRVDDVETESWQPRIDPVADHQVIDGQAPLLTLIECLVDHHWLFVRSSGTITGFVSRSDLQRPPFRMLLFGLISLFEMRLLTLVKHHYSEAGMADVLTPSRWKKAQRLHADRELRHEELHLADCLQIADKRDLLLAIPDGAARLGFESYKKGYRFFANVEALRDRLVHANDLIAGSSWEDVLRLTIELADFLNRTQTP